MFLFIPYIAFKIRIKRDFQVIFLFTFRLGLYESASFETKHTDIFHFLMFKGSRTLSCADKLSNCAEYTHDACAGAHESWAMQNCPNYCNICSKLFIDYGCNNITDNN